MRQVGPDLAAVARLIGDGSRATILWALMDGSARPAGELSARAGVTPQTASGHLAMLVEGGLLRASKVGRERRYALSGPEVARALEALSLVAPHAKAASLKDDFETRRLRAARTCYDHLAGSLGVAITEAMVHRVYVLPRGEGYEVSAGGEDWLAALGVSCDEVRARERAFGKACLDWSERRPHLAGALGAAIAGRLFELEWVQRIEGTRALTVTGKGRRGLRRELDIA